MRHKPYRLFYALFTLLLFTAFQPLSHAATPEVPLIEGQDYDILPPQAIQDHAQPQVLEFFSYGCPWCSRLDPTLTMMATHLPANTTFQRVPVIFEPGWENLAKAYYTAEGLNVLDRLHPLLFQKVQTGQLDSKKVPNIKALFIQNGVTEKDFDAFFDSFSVNTKVQQGKKLFEAYQLYATPVIIVNGRYKTDLQHAKGQPDELVRIIEGLLKKKP